MPKERVLPLTGMPAWWLRVHLARQKIRLSIPIGINAQYPGYIDLMQGCGLVVD